jgi:hypothetical protein
VQPYDFDELGAFDDRDLGALFTAMDNSSVVSFSASVMADPCPSIEWIFNDTVLRMNDFIAFNNPCMGVIRGLNWTFTLNVTITSTTSGSYTANLSNIAGTIQLPKALYFTLAGIYT